MLWIETALFGMLWIETALFVMLLSFLLIVDGAISAQMPRHIS